MEMFYGIIAFIVLFIVLRAFFLWYWRINELVDATNNINQNLEKLLSLHSSKIENIQPKNTVAIETEHEQSFSDSEDQQAYMKSHGIKWSVLKNAYIYDGNKYKTIEEIYKLINSH